MSSAVCSVGLPSPSLVGSALVPQHYWDAYAIDVAAGTFETVDRFARAATRLSLVGRALMKLRDLVVRPFGLQVVPEDLPAASHGPIEVGGVVGLFKVLARSDEEIVMGLDDKHLDFRLSMILRTNAQTERAIATTTVRFHNRFGRLYFAIVKPVHKLLVPSMLRRAAKASA